VAQQRLPFAAPIARALPDIPIVLRLHNLQKSFSNRLFVERCVRRTIRQRLYNRLAGIVHVSETCQTDFENKWPEVRVPSCVVGNGLDFSEWVPGRDRAPEVLLVARCVPEKGVLEAVQGMAKVLPEFPGWRAHVILSSVDEKPAYAARVFQLLEKHRDVFRVETNRPFAEMKAATERAAIAVVPSKWVEPFGRTALEAHAGGAALISSGTGGLSEISGETALMLPDVSPEAIEAALRRLLTDEAKRTRLARAGQARAQELFDIRTQAAAMDQFLERIALEKAGERHV
jgi:glycosyltransferase involved in cell wall biosynthesis